MSTPQQHWEDVWTRKGETEVSWFQVDPAQTLRHVDASGVTRETPTLLVGAGATRLLDELLARGFTDLTALDLSAAALEVAKRRLGARAEEVRWVVADVTTWIPPRKYGLWLDRAVFHFLTEPEAQQAYAHVLGTGTAPGSVVVMETFAPDGLERCSGLPVRRWSADALSKAFGSAFSEEGRDAERHVTPSGNVQSFVSVRLRRDQAPTSART